MTEYGSLNIDWFESSSLCPIRSSENSYFSENNGESCLWLLATRRQTPDTRLHAAAHIKHTAIFLRHQQMPSPNHEADELTLKVPEFFPNWTLNSKLDPYVTKVAGGPHESPMPAVV